MMCSEYFGSTAGNTDGGAVADKFGDGAYNDCDARDAVCVSIRARGLRLMATTLTKWPHIMVGLTIGYLRWGMSPLTAQDDCKAILEAESKLDNTPSHIYHCEGRRRNRD